MFLPERKLQCVLVGAPALLGPTNEQPRIWSQKIFCGRQMNWAYWLQAYLTL